MLRADALDLPQRAGKVLAHPLARGLRVAGGDGFDDRTQMQKYDPSFTGACPRF
jgi:hypothetical protein